MYVRWLFCLTCCFALFLAFAPRLAYAGTYPTNSQALSACEAFRDSSNPDDANYTYQKKCFKNLYYTNPNQYICKILRTTKSNGNKSAGFCGKSPTVNTGAETWYANHDAGSVGCSWDYVFCFTSTSCNVPGFDLEIDESQTYSGNIEAVCSQGCSYFGEMKYVGTYPSGSLIVSYVGTGESCSPTDFEFNDPNDTSIEDVKDMQDADGDGKSDDEDVCPNDPTDTCNIPDRGKDTDGDGVPDFQDPSGTSSGGGDCVTPPSCSGDAVQCNILYQTWAGRCGQRGSVGTNNPSSGDSGAGGDGTDVSGIESRLDTANGFLDDILSLFDSSEEPADFSSLDSGEETIDSSVLDSSGFGYSRSCPSIPSFSISFFGSSQEIDFGSKFCDATSWVGNFIVLLGSFLGVLAFFKVR